MGQKNRWLAVGGFIALSLLTVEQRALAQEQEDVAVSSDEHRLQWHPSWRRFNALDYVWTGAVVTGSLAAQYVWNAPTEARWQGGILVDDAVRDALVAQTNAGRQRASRVSDVLNAVSLAQPAVVDGIFVPLADDLNVDVAWRMSILNAQAIGLAGLLTFTGKRLTARERPVVQVCRTDPTHDDQCRSGPNSSFPSGHGSSAFAGAGLTCAHHANLPLYGDPTLDVLACAFGLSAATMTGAMRIVADRHHASDVVAAAVIGFGVGYGLPAGLYYSGDSAETGAASDSTVVRIAVVPQARGISVVGDF